MFKETQYKSLFKLNRPRERAFKQFKCPRPKCVKEETQIQTVREQSSVKKIRIYEREINRGRRHLYNRFFFPTLAKYRWGDQYKE